MYEITVTFPADTEIEVVEALWNFESRISHYGVTLFKDVDGDEIDLMNAAWYFLQDIEDAICEHGASSPKGFVLNAGEKA